VGVQFARGNAEKIYLEGLRTHLGNRAVQLKLRTRACSPSQLVEHARKIAASERDAAFAEVWCVCDVDDYPDIPEAARLARRTGIRLAVSNPCFKLWLLLHRTEHTAEISTAEVMRLLRKHQPGYDKTDLSFVDFAPGVPTAGTRAEKLDPT
jgi:hypothetical protein